MKQNIKLPSLNQRGSVLPLTLFITLLTATLLYTFANQLQSQALFFGSRQLYEHLTLLEKKCVYDILTEVSDPNFIPTPGTTSRWVYWDDGTSIYLTYTKGYSSIEVGYKINYNETIGKGRIIYDLNQKTYVFKN
ncbi:MAG: hypothetical protein ACRCST_12030 [Turicibacter sp.]